MTLHSILKSKVAEWRNSDYQSEHAAVSEILDFNYDSETQAPHFLRKAQFEALETYWYLRLQEKTPHIFELHKRLYPNPLDFLKVLGIPTGNQEILELALAGGIDSIIDQIRTNDEFVKGIDLRL